MMGSWFTNIPVFQYSIFEFVLKPDTQNLKPHSMLDLTPVT
jgi:hypothetical protein